MHIFCQRRSFYVFQNFNTSVTYREFNLGRHVCSTLKKSGFYKFELQLPSSLLVFGILVIHRSLFLVLNHYLNSQTL